MVKELVVTQVDGGYIVKTAQQDAQGQVSTGLAVRQNFGQVVKQARLFFGEEIVKAANDNQNQTGNS